MLNGFRCRGTLLGLQYVRSDQNEIPSFSGLDSTKLSRIKKQRHDREVWRGEITEFLEQFAAIDINKGGNGFEDSDFVVTLKEETQRVDDETSGR